MEMTLGEKLRQAREERGISISEVAEQTRISPLYLKSIENDDYKPLPGGIFNKGFVRTYSRYIGFDEQEAMRDYAELIAANELAAESDQRVYRPEVLIDDRSVRSMAPSIIFAVVILSIMTIGLILLVRYLTSPGTPVTSNLNTATGANVAANSTSGTAANSASVPGAANNIVVEIKAIAEPVWISFSIDGSIREQTLAPDESAKLEARDDFRLSYARIKADKLQITVNGKQIRSPANGPKGKVEIEINNSNLSQIIQSG